MPLAGVGAITSSAPHFKSCACLNSGYNQPMVTTVKITTIGNSAGIILPKELLDRLRVSKGDTLTVTETPDGVQLSTYDESVSRQMEIAERIMRENRNMLRKLGQ
jgi:putative addiction module antidote